MAADEDVKYIDDGLASIGKALGYDSKESPTENYDVIPTADIGKNYSVTENTAYHDYYRIELGSPLITTVAVDTKLPKQLAKVLTITQKFPHLFGAAAKTSAPTDASEVEDLVAEIRADLATLGAGPVPGAVLSFVTVALGDQLDQGTWNAMSIAQRERPGQIAAAWVVMTTPPGQAGGAAAGDGSGGGASTTSSGSSGVVDTLKHIVDPGGLIPW
jgi:hypothetical protein